MANENQKAAATPQPQSQSPQQSAGQSEAFVKHLEHASSVVQSWPPWKQQVLGGTATQQAAGAKR